LGCESHSAVLQGLRGNLLDDGVRTYEYDYANRLIEVVSSTFTTTFAYNGDGHRVAKAENGVATSYVVAMLGLSQVLVETTGGQTTRYVYGHDLLAEHDGEAWAWHLNDGLGSARSGQLADGNGDVTLAQCYTPFGVPLLALGAQAQVWNEGNGTTGYGFTGERWEAYGELLFLRARYYQPITGRFLTRDPWPGVAQRPVSRHAYLHASANPVVFIDPLGLYDCSAWPPDLVGLCRILDSSLVARYAFYNAVVVGTSQMGWADASMLTAHYLYGSGQAMYLGSRTVKLIERDAAQPINEWRTEYLSWASEQMGGRQGNYLKIIIIEKRSCRAPVLRTSTVSCRMPIGFIRPVRKCILHRNASGAYRRNQQRCLCTQWLCSRIWRPRQHGAPVECHKR